MKQLRALIVDDSSVMRKIVQRAFQQAGVEFASVMEAGNGQEALELIAKNQFDLILSDINMPVMDGLTFVRELKSVDAAKGVPVIMITTEGSQTQVMEAIQCGARGYIRKPFTADQVKSRIAPLFESESAAQ